MRRPVFNNRRACGVGFGLFLQHGELSLVLGTRELSVYTVTAEEHADWLVEEASRIEWEAANPGERERWMAGEV